MIYGLMGHLSTGKSTLMKWLEHIGYDMLYADSIAKNLLLDKTITQSLIEMFSFDIVDENQKINFSKLGNIVFRDETELMKLNSFIHPLLKQEIIQQLQKKDVRNTHIIIEAAILIQIGLHSLCDRLIWVDSYFHYILERAIQKAIPTQHILFIYQMQKKYNPFVEYADIKIINNLSMDSFFSSFKNTYLYQKR